MLPAAKPATARQRTRSPPAASRLAASKADASKGRAEYPAPSIAASIASGSPAAGVEVDADAVAA